MAAGTAAEAFATEFRGEVLRPEDPGYDAARLVFNGMYQRRPAQIARCGGPADVIAAVNYARAEGLEVAVRGGGHSVQGYSSLDDGLVIDLNPMKGARVDPGARTVAAARGHDVGRARPRDAGARPGGHRRADLEHRHRRAHARKRQRLAGAQPRAELRPPAVRRPGDRRRAARPGQRDRGARAVLGAQGRGGELRHRHRAGVPAPPRGPDRARRDAAVPARPSRGAPDPVPRT